MLFRVILGVVVLLVLILAPVSFYLYRQVMRLPDNRPAVFLTRPRPAPPARVVVCAGDSITHGNISANYVNILSARLGEEGYVFVNAGINSELAYNLRLRLDEIIACQPDAVTILIGTNDLNATLTSQRISQYTRLQKLPVVPTLAWYRENLQAIVQRLKDETQARIALLSPPVLGEALDARPNQLLAAYVGVVREVAAAEGVAYLPLNEQMTALLRTRDRGPRHVYDGLPGMVFGAAAQYYLLGRTWNAIAYTRGFMLLTDHIHLNEAAAMMVADLIEGFLRRAFEDAGQAAA